MSKHGKVGRENPKKESKYSEGTPEGDKEMRRSRRFTNIMRKRLKTIMSERMETIMSRKRTKTTMREGG